METGISFQGFVPIRKEPSHGAEMGSQILFGETFHILESKQGWCHISLDFDGFEGWVHRDSIVTFEAGQMDGMGTETDIRMVVQPSVGVIDLERARPVILPAGSLWRSASGKSMGIQGHHFELLSEEGLVIPGNDKDPEEMGMLLLSIPGLHGGRSGFGFDGAGLVQFLCRATGISLPRDCAAQSEMGITINFMHEIRKGDLAFFSDREGAIIHVGMAIGEGRILHAWDQVRMDKLDQQGIYSTDKESYTHQLRIIKRIEPS